MKKEEKTVIKHLKHDVKEAKKGIKEDKTLMGKLKPKGKK